MRSLLTSFIILASLAGLASAEVQPSRKYTCGDGFSETNQHVQTHFKDRPFSAMTSYSTSSTTLDPTLCLSATTNGLSGKGYVAFIQVNREPLWQEIAQGGGERLETLASLIGCEGVGRKMLGQVLKAHFELVVASESQTSEELWERIEIQIRADPQLSHQCYLAA